MCIAICLPSGFELVGIALAFERDQHADLAEIRRGSVVDVRHDHAMLDRDRLHPADRLVLTDRRDVAGQLVGDRAAARIVGGLERVDIVAAAVQRDLRHVADEVLELLVLGDEIGLGIDLDGHALRAGDGNADEALGRGAARLLGSRGKALGAQCVDRRLDIAAAFVERLLAIHHAGAGALAQVLHVKGGIGHCVGPS